MNYYITVDLTEEQIKEVKIVAVREGKTVKQLVRELIIKRLEDKYD